MMLDKEIVPSAQVARRWLVGACLLTLLLPFVFFWQVWWPFTDRRWVFDEGDFDAQHYPMRSFVVQEYRQGRLPLWSPYTFSGEPAVAESLYTAFYPLSLWQVIFPQLFFLALELEVIAYLGLAGMFTLLFVRELTGRLDAGLVAGVTFGLSGFLTAYPMLQMVILQVALWLPAGLWLLERGLRRRSLVGVAGAGIAFGLGLLGGHFQTFLYLTYATGAYLLFRVLQLKLPLRFVARAAVILGLVVVAVGAPQWLPSAQMAGRSPRAGLSYAEVAHGFSVADLLGLIRPNWGEWSPLYVGVAPLLLTLFAVVGGRRGAVGFWGGLALVALLLSLGGNGFLYPLFHAIAPGFGLFRDQERAAFLVSFSLAVLAGYGYAALARRRWWARSLWAPVLVLIFLDLFRASGGVILQAAPAGGYDAPTAALTYVQAHTVPPARISSEARLPLGGNAGLRFALRDVTGNGPLYQAMYERFLEIVPEVRWWQLLNVQHVVTQRTFDYPGITQVLADPVRGEYVHHLDLGGRPAWIAHAAEIMPSQEAAIYYTSDVGKLVDPLETVVLETSPDPTPQPATGAEMVRLTHFSPQRVALEAELSAPSVVVLSEIAYPGWRVTVNGERTAALRAYGVLRAVALPAGRWEIVWRFRPWVVYVGLALHGAAVLGVGVAWLLKRRSGGRT